MLQSLTAKNIFLTSYSNIKFKLPGAMFDQHYFSAQSKKHEIIFDALDSQFFYMAPEMILRSHRKIKSSANVWSFGVTLCEILSGRRLFWAKSLQEVIEKMVEFTGIPSQ